MARMPVAQFALGFALAAHVFAGQAAEARTCGNGESDWMDRMPAHQSRIVPQDCKAVAAPRPAIAWPEARDRRDGSAWSLTIRNANTGGVVQQRTDLDEPRALIDVQLNPGSYEWSVTHIDKSGRPVSSRWRSFDWSWNSSAHDPGPGGVIPDGAYVAQTVAQRTRPRVLPADSSWSQLRTLAADPSQRGVYAALRAIGVRALAKPVPAAPDAPAEASVRTIHDVSRIRTLVHTARGERFSIEALALIGHLENRPDWLAAARARLMGLAAWAPDGSSSEKNNNMANREVYLGMAMGLDMLWDGLSGDDRRAVANALRARVLQGIGKSGVFALDRDPYASHPVANVRWLTQALMLVAGLDEFPEAGALLERLWNMNLSVLKTWTDESGGFGNGVAYAWYAFIGVVPYVAAVRAISGVDLYRDEELRRQGDFLIAFTAPGHQQMAAFGDEMETPSHHRNIAPSYYRLHAQLSRRPVDAWYWGVDSWALNRIGEPLVWQLLLLPAGTDPTASPPTQNDWFFYGTGMAAMHVDARVSARTSVFFRSSRFGSFNHSHADQNSFVYVSKGKPLLINAGYYPYYGSPHHKSARATRYKNALTFDGGTGQAEPVRTSPLPREPVHSMDVSGRIINAGSSGSVSYVTGDATQAYRAYDPKSGALSPLLTNAIRTVVMDKARGVTLVYDWATSETPRQWELNLHSPRPFTTNGDAHRAADGDASVCIERHGPSMLFQQTAEWEIPPETPLPPQFHGRYTALERSKEFAHLTVLREGCLATTVRAEQSGHRIDVDLGGLRVMFSGRELRVR